MELLAGYGYAQVLAPKDKDYIALEPMTAPASALTGSCRRVSDSELCSESVWIEAERLK